MQIGGNGSIGRDSTRARCRTQYSAPEAPQVSMAPSSAGTRSVHPAGCYKLLHKRAEWLEQDPACASPTQKDGHRTSKPPNSLKSRCTVVHGRNMTLESDLMRLSYSASAGRGTARVRRSR